MAYNFEFYYTDKIYIINKDKVEEHKEEVVKYIDEIINFFKKCNRFSEMDKGLDTKNNYYKTQDADILTEYLEYLFNRFAIKSKIIKKMLLEQICEEIPANMQNFISKLAKEVAIDLIKNGEVCSYAYRGDTKKTFYYSLKNKIRYYFCYLKLIIPNDWEIGYRPLLDNIKKS